MEGAARFRLVYRSAPIFEAHQCMSPGSCAFDEADEAASLGRAASALVM